MNENDKNKFILFIFFLLNKYNNIIYQIIKVIINMNNNLPEGYNLTDDDVLAVQKKLVNIDPKQLNEIYNTYKQTLNSMLAIAKEQAKMANEEDDIITIEHICRVLNLAPVDEIFIRSKEKIWHHQDKIIHRDAKYFIEKNYSAMIKKDKNQAFLESLISIIKSKFLELTKEQQNVYWARSAALLNCVIRFKKLVGEYSD